MCAALSLQRSVFLHKLDIVESGRAVLNQRGGAGSGVDEISGASANYAVPLEVGENSVARDGAECAREVGSVNGDVMVEMVPERLPTLPIMTVSVSGELEAPAIIPCKSGSDMSKVISGLSRTCKQSTISRGRVWPQPLL